MTENGAQTLEFFEKEISPEIKRDITNYLVTHSYEMRNESSTLADYFYRTSNQDFAVHCMVKEGKTTLIELTFTVPTEAAAQTLCENWKKKSQEDIRGNHETTDVRTLREGDGYPGEMRQKPCPPRESIPSVILSFCFIHGIA